MHEKKIVIWGAGRIGRGFIGDLFNEAGYHLVLIDSSQDLVEDLNCQGKYSVFRASGDQVERVEIVNFTALHVSQEKEIQASFDECDIMAVSVYPQHFEVVAKRIQQHLINRRQSIGDQPFDILLCTNLIHAGPKFSQHLLGDLDEESINYIKESVGVIESLVIRICPEPPADIKQEYPLVVWTNGYDELPIDKNAIKGNLEVLPSLRLVTDMRAEEIRKIYTYNMCHAVLSYHGQFMGYDLLVECLDDQGIRNEAEGALEEVSQALISEYGFTQAEMDDWIKGVLTQTNNPTIGDSVIRSAADPIRKLKRDDRLVGPLLLCKRNGIEASHLIRAIAAAFHFVVDSDKASQELQEYIQTNGIEKAIFEYCGLAQEESEEIAKIISEFETLPVEYKYKKMAQEAYLRGFENEKVYHGCGQCVLAAVTETLDVFEPKLFEAATGLCGGIGLNNDGTCAALVGGSLAIGLIYARTRDHFDGDKEAKYKNFQLVQELREKFINEYGTIICGEIHKAKYGRAYNLSLKDERDLFEENGGHSDNGCTQVVAKAAKWTIEVLANQFSEENRP